MQARNGNRKQKSGLFAATKTRTFTKSPHNKKVDASIVCAVYVCLRCARGWKVLTSVCFEI